MLEGIFHDDIHSNATCLTFLKVHTRVQRLARWIDERHKSERFDRC